MRASSAEKQRPFSALVQTLVAEVTLLIRQELQLAAAESRPKLARTGAGLGLLVAAAVFAFGALGTLTAAAIVALAMLVPLWLAALIVTFAYVLACAGAALRGIAVLKTGGSFVPAQTLQTIKEDVLAVRAGLEQAR